MADMDLDDLDISRQAPARPNRSRFAPKSKVKTEPAPSSSLNSGPPPVQLKSELDSKPLLKKDELDTKPPSGLNKDELTDFASVGNSAVAMDVDAKIENDQKVEKAKDEDINMEQVGEDEVVKEFDVHFSPSIDPNTKLYVMQYPLRPLWRPYELDERCEEVRVKPASGQVEVDLTIDEKSENYDLNADPRVRITKQTLSSSWNSPTGTAYAVGVLSGNKLHLNPIHTVVQLRPSLKHLKPGGSRMTGTASNVEDKVKAEDIKEKPTGTSSKKIKMLGTINEQNKEADEWMPLKYQGATSDISAQYLHMMMKEEGSLIQFSMSSNDYVNSLCGTSNGNVKSGGPSIRSLLHLPLEERFKAWLREGPPVNRFDTLKHLAPDNSDEEILGVLQKYAQLVQGLWVPTSALLFGTDTGVNVLARDNILVHFTKNLVISNKQLPQRPDLANATKNVLSVLALQRPSCNDWKFIADPDVTFVKLYPDIVKQQVQDWIKVENKISAFFSKIRSGVKSSSMSKTPDNPITLKSSDKVASSKVPSGSVSRKSMSKETREALPEALKKVLHHHKACSFQQICQRLREMAVSESSRPKGFAREAIAAAFGVDAPPEELQAIINEVAVNIHGVYVLRSSPEHPELDMLRKTVIDLFIAEGPNAKLKKASIYEAAKQRLNRDINTNEFQQVMRDLCVAQGSAWMLKSGDGISK